MNLMQLEVIVAVNDEGSFTEAAEALVMTQSGVSHAVASLEVELGVRLFARGRHGATPSDVGLRVVEHAREMLSQREHIVQRAQASRGLQTGLVRVGGFSSACARLLPGILGAFRRRHPQIDVDLSHGTDEEVREWVATSRVDVGFVFLPADGLATDEIAEDRMVAVVPSGHRLGRASVIDIADLAAEPLLVGRGRSEPIVAEQFRQAGVTMRPQFVLQDLSVLFAMVQEGLGVTILPAMAIPPETPGLCVRSVEPAATRAVGLAVRPRQSLLPAARAFRDCAREWALDNHPALNPYS
jgi:DNA-binding transcriptional LysR family regulator